MNIVVFFGPELKVFSYKCVLKPNPWNVAEFGSLAFMQSALETGCSRS